MAHQQTDAIAAERGEISAWREPYPLHVASKQTKFITMRHTVTNRHGGKTHESKARGSTPHGGKTMAWVENVRLDTEQQSKQACITVTFRVYFSVSDRRLDIPYRVHSAIFEDGEATNNLIIHRNGTRRPTIHQQDGKAFDDVVIWLDSVVLKPEKIEDGQEITLTKKVSDQLQRDQEYVACVLLFSDISDVTVYSNKSIFRSG